jgi:hypothetical protein
MNGFSQYVSRFLTKTNEYTIPQEREQFMTNLIQRISKILDQFMANDTQFTILDVSNAIKADGEDFVRHSEVKTTVKPILDIIMKHNSVYEIHQIEVKTPYGPAVADLYTPYHISPDNYTNVSQVASKPKNVNVIPSPIAVPANIVAQSSFSSSIVPDVAKRAIKYKLVKPRSDGAITVPKVLLDSIGIMGTYNLCVNVVNHPNSISIVLGTDKTVKDEFRISKSMLANSNISDVPVFVCAFQDKIVIAAK